VLQLDGDDDGPDTVIPHDDAYPEPRLRGDASRTREVDGQVGLHPSRGGFVTLLESGRPSIARAVGHPRPGRIHFESMATWHADRPGPEADATGWLARALDARATRVEGDAPANHVAEGAARLALPGAGATPGRPSTSTGSAAGSARPGRSTPGTARPSTGSPPGPGAVPARSRSSSKGRDHHRRRRTRLRAAALGGCGRGSPESLGRAQRLEPIARPIEAGLTAAIDDAQAGGLGAHAGRSGSHSIGPARWATRPGVPRRVEGLRRG
jgi:hypothetical protein